MFVPRSLTSTALSHRDPQAKRSHRKVVVPHRRSCKRELGRSIGLHKNPNPFDEEEPVLDRFWAPNLMRMNQQHVTNCPSRRPGQFGTCFLYIPIRFRAQNRSKKRPCSSNVLVVMFLDPSPRASGSRVIRWRPPHRPCLDRPWFPSCVARHVCFHIRALMGVELAWIGRNGIRCTCNLLVLILDNINKPSP